MEASKTISLRSATPDDDEVAVELILLAAQKMLVSIFGDGNVGKTQQFLRTAWHIQQSQFGYGRHTLACIDSRPVGICTHWQSTMPEIFAKDTARAILNFYTLEDAKLVINRSQAATHSISTPKHNELVVGHLAVLPDFHRQGVGTALLAFAAETARQLNKSHLSLDVDKDNQSAIAFYRRAGFKQTPPQSGESAFLHFQKPV